MHSLQLKALFVIFILACTSFIVGCSNDNVTEPINSTPGTTEPSHHPTNFTVTSITDSTIILTWTDATGTNIPDRYLILAAEDPAIPAAPKDGISPIASALSKSVAKGVQSVTFTNLKAEKRYNLAIYPYTTTNSAINYKTDGVVLTASATTLKRIIPPTYILPLAVGNKWDYKEYHIDYKAGTTVDANKDYSMEVIGDTTINGAVWYKVLNLLRGNGTVTLAQNREDGLWVKTLVGERLECKYPAQLNTTYMRSGVEVLIASLTEKIKVTKGSFTCIHYLEGSDSALKLHEYYTPKVGLIKNLAYLSDPTGDVAISVELQNYSLK